ncbi:MAG TPA: hypothetical protein VG711_06570 [Phycisphaerales bacterium]|nr:hypothetical protein [Phycisphaerales bacterium]
MWKWMAIWVAGSFVICALSALFLRMQRVGAKPTLVNYLARYTIGRGLRLTMRMRNLTGNKQLAIGTLLGWLMWGILGCIVIAIVSPGYQPGRFSWLYGFLSGIAGAILGFCAAFLIASLYARSVNMSSFEGKRGYFVVFMALFGAVGGFLICGIGMGIYFATR